MEESASRREYLLANNDISQAHHASKVLQISGNSYSVLRECRNLERGDYSYLKVNVSGSGIKSFGYCCFYFTIAMTILFFFPIFIFCSDCFKRRVHNLFNINVEVYDAISQLMVAIDPYQCYIVVQDNNFDQSKAYFILEALKKTHVKKFQFVNLALGINTKGQNYSKFGEYMHRSLQYVKDAKSRWSGQQI